MYSILESLRPLQPRGAEDLVTAMVARGVVVKRHLDNGAIAGTVVGVCVGVALIAFCLYPVIVRCLKRRRRRRRASLPPADAEAGAAAPNGDVCSAHDDEPRRLSSTDSFKRDGSRGEIDPRRSSKDSVPRLPPSRQQTWQTNDTVLTERGFNPDEYLYHEEDYQGGFVGELRGADQPVVLKGTSADYYSPSVPSEAFGMYTQEPEADASGGPRRSGSRSSSLRHNVKRLFYRQSTRDRTNSSHASDYGGELAIGEAPHLEGATPMRRIFTAEETVESPIDVSPTAVSGPQPLSPRALQNSARGLPGDETVRTPPLSPRVDRWQKNSPSPPVHPAPGTVNPMDIMPATTDSELWHRTEHQLHYGSSPEAPSSMGRDEPEYHPIISSPSPTLQMPAPPSNANYSPDPTAANPPLKQELPEDEDVVMENIPSPNHLQPVSSNGRHSSLMSDQSTPLQGPASTTPSTQNTPSTQIDSPSPESSGHSDFRHSASPQNGAGIASLEKGAYRCDEPGCNQVFDQPHKLKHHQRYHSKDHKCPYAGCGKGFGTKTHLQRHINDRHEKKKKYHCAVQGCDYSRVGGKAFPRKDNWKRHMTNIHNMDQQDLPEPIEVDVEMTGT